MADQFSLSNMIEASPPSTEVMMEEERLREEAAQAKRDAISTPSLLGAGIDAEWIPAHLHKWNSVDEGEVFDPDFRVDNLSPEDNKALFDGVPEHMLDVYEDATSLEHAMSIRGEVVDPRLKAEEILGAHGLGTNIAVRGLAAILDPVALTAIVASEGAAAPLIWGPRISRLGSTLRGAAVSGATGGGVMAGLYATDPMRTEADILYGIAAGAVIGGPIAGALASPVKNAGARELMREAARRGNGEPPTHTPLLNEDGVDLMSPPGTPSSSIDHTDIPVAKTLDELTAEFDAAAASVETLTARSMDERAAIQAINDEIATRANDPVEKALAAFDRAAAKGTDTPGSKGAYTKARKNLGAAIRGDNPEMAPEEIAKIVSEVKARRPIADLKADQAAAKATLEASKSEIAAESLKRSELGEAVRGAGQRTNEQADLTYSHFEKIIDGGKARFNAVRGSITSQLLSSDHSIVQGLGRMMYPDAVGRNTKGAGQGITAGEVQERLFRTGMTSYNLDADLAFKAYMKETGAGIVERWRPASREAFDKAVTRAVRTGQADNAHVEKAAGSLRDMMKKYADEARAAGVRGFDDLPSNPKYLPRLFNHARIQQLEGQYGIGAVEELVAKAIHSAQPQIAEETATMLARGYTRTLHKINQGNSNYTHIQLSDLQADELRQLLNEALPGEQFDTALDDILATVRDGKGDGKMARAKTRLELDEGVSINIPGRVAPLMFTDLLQENAFDIAQVYARQMSGQIGMAKVGIKSRSDWERMIQHTRDTQARSGIDSKQLDREIRKLNLLYKSVTGQPLHAEGLSSKTLQLLREYNYARTMNQTGYAQIGELGNSVGEHGIITFMQSMPAFGSIIRSAKNGKFNNDLMDEMDHIWSFGNDPIFMRAGSRTFDEGVETGQGTRIADTVGRNLKRVGKVTSVLSLMAPITTSLERMTSIMIVKNFADMAAGKSVYTAGRLADMGLDDVMSRRISSMFNDHVDVAQGALTGRSINKLNIDKWDDVAAREAFITAVQRATHRTIQRNNTGDMAEWMTTDLGRTLTQFRSFVWGAHEKQMLRGIGNANDISTYAAWSMSAMMASMAYTAQTYSKSLGRNDQQKYLNERLSTENIAKSGLMRSSFAALTPGAVDTIGGLAGYDPVFGYGRSTGMASSFLMGNPTIDLANKAFMGAQAAISSSLRDDVDFTSKDFKNSTSILLFQNLTGIQNLLNMGANQFPKYPSID